MARQNEYVIYKISNVRTVVHTGLSDEANGVQKQLKYCVSFISFYDKNCVMNGFLF